MKVLSFLTWLLCLQLAASQFVPAFAQEAPTTSTNLDLSSGDKTVSASTVLQSAPQATINIGNAAVTVGHNDMLTAAEMVAVRQVLATGQQFLQLNEQGIAVGGGLHLQYYSGLNNLVIPEGVNAAHNAAMLQSLNLAGNLTNSGTLSFFSSNAAINSATVNAANIYNNASGLITSSLASLTLNAVNNIVNAGTIYSAGNLTMSAGNSITNSAIMQAIGNVNLLTSNIVNSGLINSLTANLNINSLVASHITVNNIAGVLRAEMGNINIRDALFAEKFHTVLWGGDLVARELNVFSGTGIVNASVNDLQGLVNIYAGEAHINAATNNLTLGTMALTGDPTFFNTQGDVTINSALSFAGQHLAIVAFGNILTTTGAGAISTASSSGSGGQINLIAGATFNSSGPSQALPPPPGDTTTTLTITGANAAGGRIDLSSGVPITSLTSASSFAGGSGGKIQLVAYAGTSSNSGTIAIPTGVTVTSSGNGAGSAGDINIIAGATSGTAITLGAINTLGGASSTGDVSIQTGTPSGNGITITNGLASSNWLVAFDNYTQGSVSTGSVTVNAGSSINIVAGSYFSSGSLTADASGTNSAGSIQITVDNTLPFVIGGATNSGIAGNVSAKGSASASSGGSFGVFASGDVTVSNWSNIQLDEGTAGGQAGGLSLNSQGGTLTVPSGTLSLNSSSGNFDGGNITLVGTSFTISGGGNLSLQANASGTGTGGAVEITLRGAQQNLNVGSGAGQVAISATGGSAGSASGTGGTIHLSIGGDLTIDPASITAGPVGTDGDGATFDFEAGTAGPGNLSISAGLSANGAGNGSGGSIYLGSNSSTAFLIGASGTNSINGTISVNSGAGGGTGGAIRVHNMGVGGITVSSLANISNTGVDGLGTSLQFFAGITGGNPDGKSVGGTITLPSGTLQVGSSGFIILNAYQVTMTGGTLTLNANGENSSDAGGNIWLLQSSPTADLTVGSGSGQFILTANGGSSTGNAGSLVVSSGRNLTVDVTQATANPGSSSGNRGSFTYTAGNTNTGILALNNTGGLINLSNPNNNTDNAGSIRLTQNSSTALTVPGSITASNGGSGAGGAISLTNWGSGGISLSSSVSQLNVDSINGTPGSIALNAGTGAVTSANAGSTTITASSINNSGANGGTVTISAGSISFPNGLILAASNNSSGGGTGGTITVKTLNPATGSISIGPNFTVNASGYNGGTINISSAGNLTIDNSVLTYLYASPINTGGKGGSYYLTAGAVGSGNLLISNALNANALGANAGTIVLSSNSATVFSIGSAATNGIGGALSALPNGSGAAGSITVINHGSGGIILGSPSNVTATSTTGTGGTIRLLAPAGPLTIANGVLSTKPASSGDGGTIELLGTAVTVTGGGALQVFADATSSGKGGTISLISTDASTSLTVGTSGGNFVLNANAVSSGNGGTVTVSSGSNLTANTASLTSSAAGTGTGASLSLIAGTAGSGNVTVNGALSANGAGNAAGGSVYVKAHSASDMSFNNVVTATSTASSGSFLGGSVTIINSGTGGISLNSGINNIIDVSSNSGAGGTITINSRNSQLSVLGGGHTFLARGNGSTTNTGGTISITTNTYTSASSTILDVSAQGSAVGNAGTINLTTLSSTFDLTINNAANCFEIEANSGSSGGNAGVVNITSGRNLTIAPADFVATVSGGNGNGAQVTLTAGAAGSSGNLLVNGNFNVDGRGTGSGGTMTLVSRSSTLFDIDQAGATNGSTGNLEARSGGSAGGAGGTISATNLGSGGIRLQAPGSIDIDPQNSGSGGTLVLNAGSGTLTLGTGTYSADAIGTGAYSGGTISLTGSSLVASGGLVVLDVSGSAGSSGNAGTVTMNATGASSDIVFGTLEFRIFARSGGASGSGAGTANITAGRDITIDPTFFTADVTGASGNGATISLNAGRNAFFSNSFNANGVGSGNGGSITITSASSTTFNIGAGTTNGINGTLSANGGTSAGAGGGSIAIYTNPINVSEIALNSMSNISVAPAAAGGNGGSITFAAGPANPALNNGTLTLPTGTLDVSATGTGAYNGGSISLTCGNCPTNAITLAADGAGTGNGGSIYISTPRGNAPINIGSSAYTINARSGTSGGNGGSVTLVAGLSLTVDPNFLDANPRGTNGNGATFNFSSGNVTNANIIVQGSLSANGVGTGNGGSITLSTTSSSVFTIGTGASVGVAGALSASSGGSGGSAGSILIFAPLGITQVAGGTITLTSVNGSGGNLSLSAGTRSPISLLNGTLSVNSSGNGAFNGGTINITASSLTVTGGGSLTLSANATGATNYGNGGSISITVSDILSSLTVGSGAGQLILSATGGAGSGGGNGGSVTLSAGHNITIAPASLTLNPQGLNGNGGSLTLTAGTSASGNVYISGALNLLGVGRGNGGTVSITSKSSSAFVLGSTATVNGVDSSAATTAIDVRSGNGQGNGGTILIVNSGTGGITVDTSSQPLFGPAAFGSGGAITLNAGSGPLSLPAGTSILDASGRGSNLASEGVNTFFFTYYFPDVNVSGGSISLIGGSLAITGSGSLGLTANAGSIQPTGNGGTISVVIGGSTTDLVLGSGNGQLLLSALGTAGGGNGGTIIVSAGRDLTVNTSTITASPLMIGNGASYSFTAGAVASSGNLLINGTLNAAAGGFSGGGSITLNSKSSTPFIVGSSVTTNGVSGSLNVNAGYSGSGNIGSAGSISISNSSGNITIEDSALLSYSNAMAFTFFDRGGASLSLATGSSNTIQMPAGVINLTGVGDGNGGSLTINTGTLTFSPNGNFVVIANTNGTGNGGTVSITTAGASSSITSGTGNGQFVISARGGIANSASGNGGSISLSSGSSVTINPLDISVYQLGLSGAGGSLTFAAGTAGSGNLFINGSLNISGRGAANGGLVSLTSNSGTVFTINPGAATNGINGTIIANSGYLSGNAGSITAVNNGSGGLTLTSASNVLLATTSGNGGTLNLQATGGTLTVPTGTYSVNGINNSNGGSITFSGQTLTISGGSALTVTANGSGAGNGGSVTVASTGGSSSLTVGAGNLVLSATGGMSSLNGNGGSITVNAGNVLTVNPTQLTAGPLGVNGNGGNYSLTGATVVISSAVSASGVGTGNGGSIAISSTSGTAFNIGTAGSNGITGALTAASGSSGGGGGSISVNNFGSGGLTIGSINNLSVTAVNGAGGTINLNNSVSSPGTLTTPSGTLSVNAAGGNFSAGTIAIKGSTIAVSGGSLLLNATASGSGNGGNISIITTGATGNITLGSATGNLRAFAFGGSSNSLSGNGGTVYVSAGQNLIVNSVPSITPQGVNGNGGNITLIAGTAAAGNLQVTGTVSATASGTGTGGNIYLGYNDSNTFTVGVAVTNSGVSSSISTLGGLLSSSGNVTIANGASSSLSIDVTGTGILTTSSLGSSYWGQINLNKSGQAVNVTGTGGLTGYLNASGTSVNVNRPNGNLYFNNVSSSSGNTTLTVTAGTLTVASSAVISATNGNVTLQNTVSSNFISIGAAANISATSTVPNSGRIYVVTGSIPGSPVAGTAPSNFTANLVNGGQIFYGANSITAQAPTNTANVDGGMVVFDTNGQSASRITLNGGVTLNSTLVVPILTSLDLTDQTVTSYIITQQGIGALGGTLIVDGFGVAQPGSTLTIQPGNLSASLSSFNIPTGVVVTMSSFTPSNTITIDVTGGSFSNQALLTGTAAFGSGSGTIVVNSTLAGTALQINGAGVLSSTAAIDISSNRDIGVAGTITAGTLNMTTTANDGLISITGSITGTSGVSLTTHGTGNITSGIGSLIQSTNSAITMTANDVAFSGSVNAGNSIVSILPNGVKSISVGGAGGTMSVLATDLAAITADTLVIGTTSQAGGLTVAGTINVSGVGAGAYNLQFNNGGTFTSSGQTITLGSKSLTVTSTGGATLDTINATSGNVSITSTGAGVTANNAITSTSGTLSFTTGASSTMTVGNGITLSGSSVFVSTSTLASSGTLTATGASGTVAVTSVVSLSISGGGIITATGTGTPSISLSASNSGANTLSFSGLNSYDPGASGSVSFNSQHSGGSITMSAAAGQAVISGASLTISTANLTFQGSADHIYIDATGASTITINSGLSGNDLSINIPSNMNAMITTVGGSLNIAPTGNGNITFNNTGATVIGYLHSFSPVNISTASGNSITLNDLTGVRSAGNFTITTPQLNLYGLTALVLDQASATMTITSPSGTGLNIQSQITTGAPNIQSNYTGNSFSISAASGQNLTFSSRLGDNTRLRFHNTSGDPTPANIFTTGAGTSVNINNEVELRSIAGNITITTPLLTLGGGSTPNININAGSFTINITSPASTNLTIQSPSSLTSTIQTTGGAISIAPPSGQSLTFTKSSSAATTLTFSGGAVSTTTTNATTTIDANVTLSADDNFLVTVNGGSVFTVNGTLRSTAADDSDLLEIRSTSGSLTVTNNGTIERTTSDGGIYIHTPNTTLTLNGTPVNPVSVTGGGPGQAYISLEAGSGTLNINSSYTFNVGTGPGAVVFWTGGTINVAASTTQTITGGSQLTIGLPGTAWTVNLGAGSNVTNANGSIVFDGNTSSTVTINAPDNATATMTATGGSISVSNGSTGAVRFGKLGATGPGTLSLQGNSVTISTNAGGLTIDASTIVTSNAATTANVNGGTLTNNGTLRSSATGNSITIQSTSTLTLAGTTGQFDQTGGGTTRFLATGAGGTITLSTNAVQNVSGANPILIATRTLILQDNSLFAATGASVITINSNGVAAPLQITAPDGSTGTISTNGGTIGISPTNGQTLIFAKSGAGAEAQLDLSGGAVTISSNGANTTINANTKVCCTDNTLTFNITGASFINNGTICTETANDTITITAGSVTTGTITATSSVIDINSGGLLTVSGPVTTTGTGSIDLSTTSGSNGNIVINANVTGAGGVTITTDGTGTVTTAVSTSISTTNSTIAITARDISFAGTLNSGTNFVMLAPNATASISVAGTSGTFSITSSDLAAITAGILSIGSTPANGRASGGVTFEGPVDVSGAGPNQAYHLQIYNTGAISNNGQTITAGNRQVYMSAFGAVDTGTITGGTGGVALESFSSSGITVSGSITVASGGTISLRNWANNGGVVVNGNLTGTGITQLIAQGSGNITQSSGSISGNTVTLTSDTGNIGTGTNNIIVNTATLTATTGGTTGSVYINDTATGNVTLTGTNSAGTTGTFFLTATNASGTGILTGPASSIQAGTVILNSTNGSIGANSTSPLQIAGSGSTNLTASAPNGSVYINSTTSIALQGTLIGSTTYSNTSQGDFSLTTTGGVSSTFSSGNSDGSFLTNGFALAGVTFNTTGTIAYAVDNTLGRVDVIDPVTRTVTTTITVGSSPVGITISPTGTFAYVANQGSDTVSVIDLSSNTVTDTITVGSNPRWVAFNPTGTTAYVTNYGSGSVSVISTSTHSVTQTITVGTQPTGIAINPSGTTAYVANFGSNNVSVINTATNTVTTTFNVGSAPLFVAFNPTSNVAYVTNRGATTLSVVNTTTNTVTGTVALGNNPVDIKFNPSGTLAFVLLNPDPSGIAVVDAASNTLVATLPYATSHHGVGFALNPTGTIGYAAIDHTTGPVNVFNFPIPTITSLTGSITISAGSSGIGTSSVPVYTQAQTLTLNSTGSIYVQNAGSTTLATNGSLNNSASGTFQLYVSPNLTTGNGNITVNDTVTGATISLLSSEGTFGTQKLGGISQGANGLLSSTSITLADSLYSNAAFVGAFVGAGSGSGNIGTSGNQIQVAAGTLTLNTGGSAFVSEANSVTLGASSVGGTLSLNTSSNGAISIGANSSAGTMNLIADGTGTITRSGAFTLTANTLNLASTDGDIGQLLTPLLTNTGTVTANTTGSVYINEFNSVTLGASTVGSTFTLNTANNGSITIADSSSATTLNLSANGSGTITRSGNFTLTGTTVNLSSGSGNIGALSTRIQTSAGTLTVNSSAAGNFIQNSGALAIGTSTVNGVLDITTTGALAHITTSGDINTPNGSLYLTANGNITTSNVVSGGAIVLQTASGTNGSIALNANLTGIVSVDLTTDGTGNVTNAGSTTISSGNGFLSGNITISANDVTFSGSVSSVNNGTVTLRPNGAKSISVGGAGGTFSVESGDLAAITATNLVVGTTTLSGGLTVAGNLDVSGSGAGAYNLTFNNGGNYTAAGQTITLGTKTLTVNALGTLDTGSVTGGNTTVLLSGGTGLTVSAPVTVTGGSVTLATTNNGNISIGANVGGGATTNVNANGSGTITSTGNFTLTGTTVNLSSGSGNIGQSGTELQTSAGTLTLTTTGSAFINEADSVTLGASSVNGTLTLTTASNGAITIGADSSAGTMNLTADGTGTITRSGIFTLTATTLNLVSIDGDIGQLLTPLLTSTGTLTANTTGSVYINEFNSVTLGASTVGSTFTLNTANNGDITIADNSSATTFNLSADGTGTITRTGNSTLTAGDLTLTSGTGDIGTVGAPILTDANSLTVVTGGNAYYSELNALTLNASTVGGTFSLIAGGAITTGGDTSADSLDFTTPQLTNANNLTATGPAGTINIQSTAGQGLTVQGGGTMSAAGGTTITATDQTLLFAGDQTFIGDVSLNGIGTSGDVSANPTVAVSSTGNMTINTYNPVGNQPAFSAGGSLVVNTINPPPAPPAPTPTETTSPTFIALIADASSASGSQLVTSRIDPIIIATDQNQGIAGNSLSQSLLSGITNGLSTIIFGGGTSDPSSTVSNGSALSNSPNTGLSSGTAMTATGPVINTDIDLSPFADLLPSGSMSVAGNVMDSKGKTSASDTPQALTAQAGTIVPARSTDDSKASALSSLGETFKVGEIRSNLVMFTMANQVFSGFIGGNNDTMVSGTPGTIFSTDKNTVVLHSGHMLTDNGKQGMTVFTQQAAVMIGADSAAVIDVHSGAPTRVMAVAGQGSSSTTVRTRDGLVIPLAAGQEVIIGQTDLSSEDLIPVDGMDREFVSGGIQVSSRKVAKDNFSLDEFMDKEIMVAGVPVRLGGNNKRLHGKISAAAKRQSRNSRIVENYHKKKKGLKDDDDETDNSTITKAPAKQEPLAQAASEPTRILAEKDTEFSLTQPGHMKLLKGSLFMHSDHSCVIETPLGQVHGARDSMFKVNLETGKARVQAMSGPDHVSVIAGKRLIPLNCGKEVFITDHKPSQSESVPADGVGRRGMSAFALDGALSAIVGDFSMVTLLNSTSFMNPLKHPTSSHDQQLHAQIVKAAAVIQQVLGNRGRYYIAPKERASAPLPDWVIKTTGDKPNKLPLLKAMMDAQ